MNPYLAKSNPKETIQKHTENLLKQYEKIKEIYPYINYINWETLRISCIYHDLGKMNVKFQNKIITNINKQNEEDIELVKDKFENIKEIPHGYLSCAYLPEDYLVENFTKNQRRIIYESIYYHHNREKLDGKREEELELIIEEELTKENEKFVFDKLINKNRKDLNIDFMEYLQERILIDYKYKRNKVEKEDAYKFIVNKGLLNKIDFAASSDVSVEIESGKLKELTEESIKPYNLNKLQEYMKKNSDENLIIKASTGIGKTEGALIWIGNNKGFFTLPLKVSINAIYDRITEKIKYDKNKTALLHSDTASEYLKRSEEEIVDKKYLDQTKQLSYPITICTLDQLINFVFKVEGFELKLATLSYSKVVIDEIQMYSPEMIGYLILALKEIVEIGGKFAIVTATFPPIFEYFMNFACIDKSLYKVPDKPFFKELNNIKMIRHKMKVFNENINSNIILRSYKNQKILVIVNTIKEAQKLYEELNKCLNGQVFMFHSRYTKEDRAKKEEKIFDDGKLENDFKGIWITTQVVEASLDIDFDLLFTELSDASGLFQRMGRVYRNRVLENDKVNINVFVGDDKNPSGISENNSIIDIDIFKKSKEEIINYDNKVLDEEEKMKIVEKVYSVDNLENSRYFNKIKDTINTFKDVIPYDLKKNENKLRDILTENIIPQEVYENNKEEIDELIESLKIEKSFSKRISIKDKIMAKTVSIPSNQFENAKAKGAIINEIEISKFERIYVFPCKYSFEKGVEFKKEYNNFNENQFI